MPWLVEKNIRPDWRHKTVQLTDSSGHTHTLTRTPTQPAPLKPAPVRAQLHMIAHAQLEKNLRQGEIEAAYAIWLEPTSDATAPVLSIHALDIAPDAPDAPDPLATARQQVIDDFLPVFPDQLPPGLPPTRGVVHPIELIPGSKPPSRPTYRLSDTELAELKKQLAELAAAGFIQPSKSPFGAPILFV